MDIENLKEIFTPEVWSALRQYFANDLRSEIAAKLEEAFPAQAAILRPLPLSVKIPPKRKARTSNGIGRVVEFPPPLNTADLAYLPAKVRKMPRKTEAVGIRRDFIAEALKAAALEGATVDEIVEHLVQANFPTESTYYATPNRNHHVRMRAAIGNDLILFLELGWVRRLKDGKWRWVRSRVSPEKEV